jgi:nitrous oxidase accessory protein NosD
MVSHGNSVHGFVLDSSSNHVVDSAAQFNGGAGYLVFSLVLPGQPEGKANGNVITDSVADDNGWSGFDLGGGNGVYKRNVSTDNTLSGFRVGGKHNVVAGNTASGNNDHGFDVTGIEHELSDNYAAANSDIAFRLPTASNSKNKLVRNVALDSDVGFEGGATLTDNVAIYSNGHGIDVGSAKAVKLTGNLVVASTDFGIYTLGGGGAVINKNRAFFNAVGIFIGIAPDVEIAGNTSLGNELDMLDFDGACADHALSNNLFGSSVPACIQ